MPDLMTVAGIALKTSLLMIAAGLLSCALRRQSAAFRHLLWTSALALCVLLPVAAFYLPSLSVLTLPLLLPRVSSAASAGGSGWELSHLPSLVITLWISGTSIVLIRELLAGVGLARWARQAYPLTSANWSATLARISASAGLGRRVRVLESKQLASPCMWGVLRPVLLLPAAGDRWTEAARYGALLHELAHVRRRDALSTLISRLACALHWYNPLMWLAAARVRSLQESACDDAVLRAGVVPSEYAQFLLDVAAHMSGMIRPQQTAIGMAHSSLRARIVAILDPGAIRTQPLRASTIAACASLLGLTIFLATASVALQAAEPARSKPPPTPELPTDEELPAPPPLPELPAAPVLPPAPEVPAQPPTPATPATPPTPPSR